MKFRVAEELTSRSKTSNYHRCFLFFWQRSELPTAEIVQLIKQKVREIVDERQYTRHTEICKGVQAETDVSVSIQQRKWLLWTDVEVVPVHDVEAPYLNS